jgi:hypothetical protein
MKAIIYNVGHPQEIEDAEVIEMTWPDGRTVQIDCRDKDLDKWNHEGDVHLRVWRAATGEQSPIGNHDELSMSFSLKQEGIVVQRYSFNVSEYVTEAIMAQTCVRCGLTREKEPTVYIRSDDKVRCADCDKRKLWGEIYSG